MTFHSILFSDIEAASTALQPEAPTLFADLNLDQVVHAVTAGRSEYNLTPYFHTRLHTHDGIAYRHEVFRDLETEAVRSCITAFALSMREMRRHLARVDKLHHRYEKQAWFIDAVRIYCDAVDRLAHDLATSHPASRGLRAFLDFLTRYIDSTQFATLVEDTAKVADGLSTVHYCVTVRGSRVKVTRYDTETDYSAEIEKTFAKFQEDAAKDYRVSFPAEDFLDTVEERVLDLVTRLYPDVFSTMDEYGRQHREFLDDTIAAFDREIQFYLAYLEYAGQLRSAGLRFCYPEVTDSKEVSARSTFDLALAAKLVPERQPVVCNDFWLSEPERIIVVSGPNQGGKTTFARTFGQLHYLATLGAPVPGSQARLFLFDELFTHFEREEDITTGSGKLEDDLVRIHGVLDRATADSVVIMNESFTSTTLQDARVLGAAVLEQLVQRDLLCVYVTFVDELASLTPTTVSMISTVDPDDPARRTYQIVRRPADGLAYADAIARKYGLTYERVKERIQP